MIKFRTKAISFILVFVMVLGLIQPELLAYADDAISGNSDVSSSNSEPRPETRATPSDAEVTASNATWDEAAGNAVEGTDYSIDSSGDVTIYTALGFAWFGKQVNTVNGYSGKTVTLANDIDLTDAGVIGYVHGDEENTLSSTITSANSWSPIARFLGTFDGGNNTISGVYIVSEMKAVGLFSYIGGAATVKNVGIINSHISSSAMYSNTGSVVGDSDGTVTNCYNTGKLTTITKSTRIAGVVGYNGGIVSDCYNTGDIISVGRDNRASGIVAINHGIVRNCYNTGDIDVTGDYCVVGGIVGYNYTTIENSYNTGEIRGYSEYLVYAGGVTAYNHDEESVLANCYNIGKINIEANVHQAGSVIGVNRDSKVENCYYLETSYDGEYDDYATAMEEAAIQFGALSNQLNLWVHNNKSTTPTLKYWEPIPVSTYPTFIEETLYGVSVTNESYGYDSFLGVYQAGAHVFVPAPFVPERMMFKNWESSDIDIPSVDVLNPVFNFTMPEKDVEISVIYHELPIVTFDLAGGNVYGYTQDIKTMVDLDFWITFPTDPFRLGYDFVGWETTDGVLSTDSQTYREDTTLIAKWQAVTNQVQELSFEETKVSKTENDNVFTNALVGVKTAVIYASTNEDVAIVSASGEVTIVGAGTAVITATATTTDEYAEGFAYYELAVQPKAPESHENIQNIILSFMGDYNNVLQVWLGSEKLHMIKTDRDLAYLFMEGYQGAIGTISDGSIEVELFADFLQNYPGGEYDISIVMRDNSHVGPDMVTTIVIPQQTQTEQSSQENTFWTSITNAIENADSGESIVAKANDFTNLPSYVMQALRDNSSVSLLIEWDGADIAINAGKALVPDATRVFYTFEYLASIYGSTITGNNPETGGVVAVPPTVQEPVEEVVPTPPTVQEPTVESQPATEENTEKPQVEEPAGPDTSITPPTGAILPDVEETQSNIPLALIPASVAVVLVGIGAYYILRKKKSEE